LIHQIIQQPSELLNFSDDGLPKLLIFKTMNELTWMSEIKYIYLSLNVLNTFTQMKQILFQLSSVNSLQWSLNTELALDAQYALLDGKSTNRERIH